MDIFIIFILGLVVGSFLNVLIDRLPAGESVVRGRSRCDHCKRTLRWFELVPIISFVIQGGTCRRCHKTLSLQYPLIELITGIGFVLLYLISQDSFIRLLAYLLIFSSLLVIFIADLKEQIIPDSMVVVAIIGAIMRLIFSMNHELSTMNAFLSATGASGFFLALWIITQGRGMGLGDVKLAFPLGLLLGFPDIIVGLSVAFLTGAGVGVILILVGNKTLKTKIAFGPFLIVGALTALIWGDRIIQLWLRTI